MTTTENKLVIIELMHNYILSLDSHELQTPSIKITANQAAKVIFVQAPMQQGTKI